MNRKRALRSGVALVVFVAVLFVLRGVVSRAPFLRSADADIGVGRTTQPSEARSSEPPTVKRLRRPDLPSLVDRLGEGVLLGGDKTERRTLEGNVCATLSDGTVVMGDRLHVQEVDTVILEGDPAVIVLKGKTSIVRAPDTVRMYYGRSGKIERMTIFDNSNQVVGQLEQ